MKISYNTMMQTVKKDIYLELILLKYPKELHELHSNQPFLPGKMKIVKCKKVVYNLFNTFIDIKALKQALDHGIILKKVHKVIEFKQVHG